MSSKNHTLSTVSLIILLFTLPKSTHAKSVYVISDTEDSNLAAYKIQGTTLVFRLCKTVFFNVVVQKPAK